MDCGVYIITDIASGRRYVGSSHNLRKRGYEHFRTLRNGNHQNPFLQNAWKKYGESSFCFDVIEYCIDASSALEREKYWISSFDTLNEKHGFNLAPDPKSMLGFKHSAESRAKMSARMKKAFADGTWIPPTTPKEKKRRKSPRKILAMILQACRVAYAARKRTILRPAPMKTSPTWRAENSRRWREIGLSHKGRKYPPELGLMSSVRQSRFTPEQRGDICNQFYEGATQTALAKFYGVTQSCIWQIVRRKQRAHLYDADSPPWRERR